MASCSSHSSTSDSRTTSATCGSHGAGVSTSGNCGSIEVSTPFAPGLPEERRLAAMPHLREVQQAARVEHAERARAGLVSAQVGRWIRPRLEARHAVGHRALDAAEEHHVDRDRGHPVGVGQVLAVQAALLELVADGGTEGVRADRRADVDVPAEPGEHLHGVADRPGNQQVDIRRADPRVQRLALEGCRAAHEEVHVRRPDDGHARPCVAHAFVIAQCVPGGKSMFQTRACLGTFERCVSGLRPRPTPQ